MAYVTIVTSGVYTIRSFVEEADKLGVVRAVPYNVAMGMSWGEIVYTADFVGQRRLRQETEDGVTYQNLEGDLYIFGYFPIEFVNISAPAEEVFEKIKDYVKEKKDVGRLVERLCGRYVVGTAFVVTCTLSDILRNFPPDTKVFIGGRFFREEQPIVIPNVKYFRGFRKIDIQRQPPALPQAPICYNLITYTRKAPLCQYCTKPVSREKHLVVDGQPFHKKCYRMLQERGWL